ncbi:unnamed protein product [Chrysoparadoxa australica]
MGSGDGGWGVKRGGKPWRRRRKVILLAAGAGCVCALAAAGLAVIGGEDRSSHEGWERRLSSAADTESCSGEGPVVLVGLIIGIFFTFNGLAIVCDEFFQASLEKISEVLKLSPDVAGATFLAAGSSAPELFTSLSDAFGPSNAIGLGTIVGSAMFNILVIVALSAAVAGKNGGSIPIDWRPVARDVSFYASSIIMLSLIFQDGLVRWWEGAIMVMAYCGYVVFMTFNERLLAKCGGRQLCYTRFIAAGSLIRSYGTQIMPIEGEGSRGDPENPTSDLISAAAKEMAQNVGEQERRLGEATVDHHSNLTEVIRAYNCSWSLVLPMLLSPLPLYSFVTFSVVEHQGERRQSTRAIVDSPGMEESTAQDNGEKINRRVSIEVMPAEIKLILPEGFIDRALFLLGVPFIFMFAMTIPDCTTPGGEKYYVLTFVMSILWIGAICHYMVEFAVHMACILSISPVIVGVLVLAVGTSVPDAIGSMIAARNGEAGMAIANAVGSNVFDILLGESWVGTTHCGLMAAAHTYNLCSAGLGFPWMIRAWWYGTSTEGDEIEGPLTKQLSSPAKLFFSPPHLSPSSLLTLQYFTHLVPQLTYLSFLCSCDR